MTRRQAAALVVIAVVAVAAIALVWRSVAAPCYDAYCAGVTPIQWLFAGFIGLAAIGLAAAVLSRPD